MTVFGFFWVTNKNKNDSPDGFFFPLASIWSLKRKKRLLSRRLLLLCRAVEMISVQFIALTVMFGAPVCVRSLRVERRNMWKKNICHSAHEKKN